MHPRLVRGPGAGDRPGHAGSLHGVSTAADPRRPSPVPGTSSGLRPAATAMLVRDGEHPTAPLEVLMVRRSLRSSFVGGAYVFPGGAVDPQDRSEDVDALCAGRARAAADRLLGLPTGGQAFWVAAVRECFEEAGVLLAYDEAAGGQLLSLVDPQRAERLAEHRRALNAGTMSLVELCRREHLRLALDRVHFFAHWIPPEAAPRRFDTRFFVAEAPPDQTPAHDAAETIDDVWVRPAEALHRHRQGSIELILPTIRNLVAIGRFERAADLVAAASRASREAADGAPVLVPDANGMRILVPGDPGYAP